MIHSGHLACVEVIDADNVGDFGHTVEPTSAGLGAGVCEGGGEQYALYGACFAVPFRVGISCVHPKCLIFGCGPPFVVDEQQRGAIKYGVWLWFCVLEVAVLPLVPAVACGGTLQRDIVGIEQGAGVVGGSHAIAGTFGQPVRRRREDEGLQRRTACEHSRIVNLWNGEVYKVQCGETTTVGKHPIAVNHVSRVEGNTLKVGETGTVHKHAHHGCHVTRVERRKAFQGCKVVALVEHI